MPASTCIRQQHAQKGSTSAILPTSSSRCNGVREGDGEHPRSKEDVNGISSGRLRNPQKRRWVERLLWLEYQWRWQRFSLEVIAREPNLDQSLPESR
jgi:hypothetical protein